MVSITAALVTLRVGALPSMRGEHVRLAPRNTARLGARRLWILRWFQPAVHGFRPCRGWRGKRSDAICCSRDLSTMHVSIPLGKLTCIVNRIQHHAMPSLLLGGHHIASELHLHYFLLSLLSARAPLRVVSVRHSRLV